MLSKVKPKPKHFVNINSTEYVIWNMKLLMGIVIFSAKSIRKKKEKKGQTREEPDKRDDKQRRDTKDGNNGRLREGERGISRQLQISRHVWMLHFLSSFCLFFLCYSPITKYKAVQRLHNSTPAIHTGLLPKILWSLPIIYLFYWKGNFGELL